MIQSYQLFIENYNLNLYWEAKSQYEKDQMKLAEFITHIEEWYKKTGKLESNLLHTAFYFNKGELIDYLLDNYKIKELFYPQIVRSMLIGKLSLEEIEKYWTKLEQKASGLITKLDDNLKEMIFNYDRPEVLEFFLTKMKKSKYLATRDEFSERMKKLYQQRLVEFELNNKDISLAAWHGATKTIKYLIEQGLDPNYFLVNNKLNNPLLNAIKGKGQIKLIKDLAQLIKPTKEILGNLLNVKPWTRSGGNDKEDYETLALELLKQIRMGNDPFYHDKRNVSYSLLEMAVQNDFYTLAKAIIDKTIFKEQEKIFLVNVLLKDLNQKKKDKNQKQLQELVSYLLTQAYGSEDIPDFDSLIDIIQNNDNYWRVKFYNQPQLLKQYRASLPSNLIEDVTFQKQMLERDITTYKIFQDVLQPEVKAQYPHLGGAKRSGII